MIIFSVPGPIKRQLSCNRSFLPIDQRSSARQLPSGFRQLGKCRDHARGVSRHGGPPQHSTLDSVKDSRESEQAERQVKIERFKLGAVKRSLVMGSVGPVQTLS
jgi:hypothetical protein